MFGYGFAFGESWSGLIGTSNFILRSSGDVNQDATAFAQVLIKMELMFSSHAQNALNHHNPALHPTSGSSSGPLPRHHQQSSPELWRNAYDSGAVSCRTGLRCVCVRVCVWVLVVRDDGSAGAQSKLRRFSFFAPLTMKCGLQRPIHNLACSRLPRAYAVTTTVLTGLVYAVAAHMAWTENGLSGCQGQVRSG